MKNLETLIQELCPDGVEFVKLGEVCEIKRGIRVVKRICKKLERFQYIKIAWFL